jgi:hypothetical protein
LFAVHVSISALRPFEFLATPRPFEWVPFFSLMLASRETAVRAFLEKAFMYGTLPWLMVPAGWTLRKSALLSTGLVLVLRLAQTFLPGRSAEITDAMMVLGLAGVMALLGEPGS